MSLSPSTLKLFPGFEQRSVDVGDDGLAMDHPETVPRLILLDVAPTLAMYEQTIEAFARSYWHCFF